MDNTAPVLLMDHRLADTQTCTGDLTMFHQATLGTLEANSIQEAGVIQALRRNNLLNSPESCPQVVKEHLSHRPRVLQERRPLRGIQELLLLLHIQDPASTPLDRSNTLK